MSVRSAALRALAIFGFAAAAGASLVAGATAAPSAGTCPQTVQNDEFWTDTSGNPIHSQGGGVFQFGDTYYWYGVEYQGAAQYENDPTKAYGSGAIFEAVTVYSSKDLVHWTFENDIATPQTPVSIPTSEDPSSTPTFSRMTSLADASWIGRLGVVYNENTHQYMLITQMENRFDKNVKTNHSVLFLTSDSPTGNFNYANVQTQIPDVLYQGTGDQTVFTDHDGTDYLVFSNQSGRAYAYVAPIDPADSLSIEPATQVSKNGAGREGNTMFAMNGHYYIASSDLHGWNASVTHVIESVGDDPLGPYGPEFTLKGTEADYSHVTQTGFFFTVHGTAQDTVVFAGDRWADFAWNGIGYNQWMPLSFNGEQPVFHSLSQWTLDSRTGLWHVGSGNNYILNPEFAADRVITTSVTGWKTTVDTAVSGNAFASNVRPGANGSQFALTLANPAGFSGSVSQDDAVPAGTYRFSLSAKATGTWDYARVRISDGIGHERVIDLSTAGSSWTTQEATRIPLTSGVVTISIEARSSSGAALSIDGLSLTRDLPGTAH